MHFAASHSAWTMYGDMWIVFSCAFSLRDACAACSCSSKYLIRSWPWELGSALWYSAGWKFRTSSMWIIFYNQIYWDMILWKYMKIQNTVKSTDSFMYKWNTALGRICNSGECWPTILVVGPCTKFCIRMYPSHMLNLVDINKFARRKTVSGISNVHFLMGFEGWTFSCLQEQYYIATVLCK